MGNVQPDFNLTAVLQRAFRFNGMSDKYFDAVWASNIRPPERKLVAIFLSTFTASDEGDFLALCNWIAPFSGLSEEEAGRHLDALVEDGWAHPVTPGKGCTEFKWDDAKLGLVPHQRN